MENGANQPRKGSACRWGGAIVRHHPTLSPSSFQAIMECACFQSKGSSADTGAGDEIHKYCAALVSAAHTHEPIDLDNVNLDTATQEDCVYMVKEALDFIRSNIPSAYIEIEKGVTLYDDSLNVVTYGTRDIGAHNQDFVVVLDWKSCLDYDAEGKDHHEQTECYALCDMREHGIKKALCIEAFVKPRKLHPYWRTYDQCAATVECVVARRNDPNRKPQACFYCKLCDNLLVCPAVNKRIAVIDACFPDLVSMEDNYTPEKITDPEIMSSAMVFAQSTIKPYAKRLVEMAERIETAALSFSEKKNIPAFVRVIKNGTKKIKDIPKAFLLSGIHEDLFPQALSLSIPKLAEIYANENGLTIKDGRKKLEGILAPVIDPGESKTVLTFDKSKAKASASAKLSLNTIVNIMDSTPVPDSYEQEAA
jgi:hypothetical protein